MISRKSPILDRPLRARPNADHFGDINEMVGDSVAAVRAGFAGFADHGHEIAEIGIFQHASEFASRPELRSGAIDPFDALKAVAGVRGGQFFAHGVRLLALRPACSVPSLGITVSRHRLWLSS